MMLSYNQQCDKCKGVKPLDKNSFHEWFRFIVLKHKITQFYVVNICLNQCVYRQGQGKILLIMIWGNTLEEDSCFFGVQIGVNPSSPSVEPLLIRNQPIHVFIQAVSFLNQIPTATHDIHWIQQCLVNCLRQRQNKLEIFVWAIFRRKICAKRRYHCFAILSQSQILT